MNYLIDRKIAYGHVIKRLEYFNSIYGYSYNNIRIKKQKTRWGSCSEKKNINFNIKIMFLPQELFDYIIVHELCHLGEFNHSRRFWNLVAKTQPNYIDLKNRLKHIDLRKIKTKSLTS
jgi:predicted metal-dependent hydrolase